jgi:hypothetical protein
MPPPDDTSVLPQHATLPKIRDFDLVPGRTWCQLDEAVLDAPQVARQINIRDVATGAFVTTWLTGTGLLGRDTLTMVRGEAIPLGQLLAGAGP